MSSEEVQRQPLTGVDDNIPHSLSEIRSAKEITSRSAQTSKGSSTQFPLIEPISPDANSAIARRPAHESIAMNSSRPSSMVSGGTYTGLPSASTSSQGSAIQPTSLHAPSLGSSLGISTSFISSAAPLPAPAPPPAPALPPAPGSSSFSSSSSSSSSGNLRKPGRANNKHSNSVPPPVWARRPSLPTMPSMGNNRVSVASVASFDSLPEGESVPHFAVSPLGRDQGRRGSIEEDATSTSGSSEAAAPSPAASSTGPSYLRSFMTSPNRPLGKPEEKYKKRRNVAMELLSTERIFVASLRLINDNYYQPLAALSRGMHASKVESSSTAAPILSRKAISEIFSNFVDILHLNVELLSRLDDRLSGRSRETPSSRPVSVATTASDSPKADASEKPWDAEEDSIGDLLVPMAPFLKMYSLFVKNFSSALTRIEAERKSNETFARFLRETERATWGRASNQGGFGFGLGFQAHLLTIVQRIPRYKLLVGDLIQCTPSSHKDYLDLCKAYAVIEQVAESINDNIRQHEMILVMLGLQRSLLGLTEPLIVPGRSLVKRGTLLKACRKNIQSREFFLFTDCFVYAAPISGSIDAASAAWQAFSRYGQNESVPVGPLQSPTSPKFPERSAISPEGRNHAYEGARIRTRTMSGPSAYEPKRLSMSLEGQQLQFRGKFSLQDCTVVAVDDVVAAEPWLRHCLEIRTPGKSFAVYAETFEVKVQWLSAIRNAREEWMSNRRTLQAEEDSIQAKRDRRRSLQVGGGNNKLMSGSRKTSFAFDLAPPESVAEGGPISIQRKQQQQQQQQQLDSIPHVASTASISAYLGDACNQALTASNPANKSKPLKILDEYNAPVWVPDSRADRCVCCNEQFGIWRRKHHCRLCGQVVCWACSSKTFLIASYEEGEEDRPARACDTCYESVFPESPLDQPSPPVVVIGEPGEDRRDSTGRPDSEVSLNTPSTPTSPTSPHFQDALDSVAAGKSVENQTTTAAAAAALTATSQHPQYPRVNKIGGLSGKMVKGRGADVQLFHHTSLLSPQVQAATSGSGTFRLVTPRLTTPEGEQTPCTSSSAVASGPKSNMNDYFAGVQPGQSELHAPRPRKKPLSAAARLSSVYGGLSSPSLSNISSKS